MPQSLPTAEILSDAQAYASVGDTDNTIAVLLEGLTAGASYEEELAIHTMLAQVCYSLWEKNERDEAKSASMTILGEILKRTGEHVDADYLDLYARALAETGTSPFPMRRLFRHRNLLGVFRELAPRESGDIAECGCAKGLSVVELCLAFQQHHPGWQGTGFHVFDSFAGLSVPGEKDAIDWSSEEAEHLSLNMRSGQYAFPLNLVRGNVHRLFPRVELHAGWIPHVFSAQPERAYRFVHIDVDLYQPTIDSLDYFFPRLSEGGIVITDDYSWPGARKAFDEFSVRNALELHATDTGQAFFVKERSN